MYAIIEAGGRQIKVSNGDVLKIEHALEENAQSITFDRVLLIGSEGQTRVGTPAVAGASVTADVLREVKGPKIDIVKYKRRKGYDRKTGHRQPLVEVKITAINA